MKHKLIVLLLITCQYVFSLFNEPSEDKNSRKTESISEFQKIKGITVNKKINPLQENLENSNQNTFYDNFLVISESLVKKEEIPRKNENTDSTAEEEFELKDNNIKQPDLDDLSNKKYSDYFLVVSHFFPEIDYKDIVDQVSKRPISYVMTKFDEIKHLLELKKIKEKFHVNKPNEAVHSDNQDFIDKKAILTNFINTYFNPPRSDLEQCTPDDYVDLKNYDLLNPFTPIESFKKTKDIRALIANLKNKDVVEVLLAINLRWKSLCQRKSQMLTKQNTTTLIDLPNYFIIPGGRFRETYYWDTYYIMQGLIISGMNQSVLKTFENLMYMINKFGFIPNGTRTYYLNRSQPPYFSIMLKKVLKIDPSYLEKGLKAAEKEYNWWMRNKKIIIKKKGTEYTLNLYRVISDTPRLESYREDMTVFKNVLERQNKIRGFLAVSEDSENKDFAFFRSKSKGEEEKYKEKIAKRLFSNLKSAAESGYDFSTRWQIDENDLGSISIVDMIPVDLNVILFKTEKILSKLYYKLGNKRKGDLYLRKYQQREEAINKILWNHEKNVWMDWNYRLTRFQDKAFYPSNLLPLAFGIKPPVSSYKIIKMYEKELFSYPGGIPASSEGLPQKQQWDFPNAWPPHQHMAVKIFMRMKEPKLALNVAQRYYQSVYNGYKNRNEFAEKYLANDVGGKGGGGEYVPQTGFGWSNSVFLKFADLFGDELSKTTSSFNEISSHLDDKVSEVDSKINK
jgi:alpha,alpha-trehalase